MSRAEEIRDAIGRAVTYLEANPQEAKATDNLATARLVEGLVVRVTGLGGESITTDMVPSVGGTGSAPSPGWLLRAAEASCVATLIAMRAAMLGVTLTELEVDADSESDDRGLLGIGEDVPAGPLRARIAVSVAGSADEVTLHEIAEWGIRHCPVCDAIERPIPVTHQITVR